MDLTSTVSHLAEANHQLAAAHNLTLGHLQWLLMQTAAERRRKAKTACPNCRGKEREAKNTAIGKVHAAKRITKANKSLRRLKKLPAFDESREAEAEPAERLDLVTELRNEIQELNAFKLTTLDKNERLTNDLMEQRLLVERLTQHFEDSRRECEKKEASLEQVSKKLRCEELENVRLLAELNAAKCAQDVAEAALRTKVAEGQEERRKHLLTLDEATQQIQALEVAARTVNDFAQRQTVDTATEETNEDSRSSSGADALEKFKKELMLKREARQRAIAAISSEMDHLRRELQEEKAAHADTASLLQDLRAAQPKTDRFSEMKTDEALTEFIEVLRLSDLLKISDEVSSDLWLQLERNDDLRFQLENNPEEHRLRIGSLKQLSEETQATMRSRKQQVNLLKDRLAQILVQLGDRCPGLERSDDIRRELERELEDMGRSRALSDERSRILTELKDQCFKEIRELRIKLDSACKNNRGLEEDFRKREDKLEAQGIEILNLESQLGLAKADCRDLQNQMSVINSLFGQMLLGASSAEMDLDRLTRLLQENHDLISAMAKENGTEAAALPKLLLDIIEQVDGRARENEDKKEEGDLQEENIAHNLPKVWRVLLELLSCQVAGKSGSNSQAASAESSPDSCYKSVDTPTGPRLVISVSKTYIRLKELILEKKHLEKEMNRMKQLNTHLESKLSEQEQRLSTVSDELSKTWNVVGRMQAQHQQLHTHEKILRYELQQKRKMLQELKQKLEYCRETWECARQKNTNTEKEWRILRREFAARKALVNHTDSFNNSGESGFSDERDEESDDDEDEEKTEIRVRPINSRRRSRKDELRAITPDTESEQPTDTELSETKTLSSSTSGQRTPTPETEAELESSEIIEEDPLPTFSKSDDFQDSKEEILDPMEKALTNVIQNLLQMDESKYTDTSSNTNTNVGNVDLNLYNTSIEKELEDETEVENIITVEETDQSNTKSESENLCQTSTMSVFSIGPFPPQTIAVKNVQFSNPLEIGPSSKILENFLDSDNTKFSTSKLEEDNTFLKVSELSTEMDNVSIDSSSSLDTVKEFTKIQNENIIQKAIEANEISTSESKVEPKEMTEEIVIQEKRPTNVNSVAESSSTDILDARAARLQRLEQQAEWLVKKVSDTNRRGTVLNSRLEELHETYGSIPTAPSMPDVLPTFRLQNEVEEEPVENTDHMSQMDKREKSI